MFSVTIINDQEVVRLGLQASLETRGFQIARSYTSGQQMLEDYVSGQGNTDAVLVDVLLPDIDGFEVLSRLREHGQTADSGHVAVLMFSCSLNETYVGRSIALGANGFVHIGDSLDSIGGAVMRACRGEPPSHEGLFAQIQQYLQGDTAPQDWHSGIRLTGREVQVLRHLALGLSNREIANSLCVSVETIKEHIQNLLRKLNARDRTDAAVQAARAGFATFSNRTNL